MLHQLIAKSDIFTFAADVCQKNNFLFLPPWWEYLKIDKKTDGLGQCSLIFNPPGDFLAIGLAILDILLRLAGFAAVVSIMIAGLMHLFTGGNPEKAAAARKRLLNSIIGLVIAFTATLVVTFIGNQLVN